MSGSSEQLNKFIKQFIILKTKKDVKDLLTKHEKLFLSDEEARQRLIAHIEDSLDSSEKTYIVLANIVYCLEFFLQVVTEGRTQDATRVRESHTVELIIFLKRTYIALDLLHTPKLEVKQLKLDIVSQLKRLISPPANGASCLPRALELLQTFTLMIRDSDTEIGNGCKGIDEGFFRILETEHFKVKNSFNLVDTLTHLAGCLADSNSKVKSWALKSLRKLLEIEKLELWRHIQHFLRQLIQIAGTSTEAEDPNFSKQLRNQFSKKNASKDRDYCILLLMELSSHSSQNQNPRKLCKVLKWVRDIFLIQLDPNHPANREPKEDKLSMSTIEKSSPLTGRSSLSPILSQSERSNLLTFETLVSQNLQLALTCQSSEDRELSKLAGELNKLIKERIIDIIKWEKDRGTNKLFFRIFEGLQSLIASQQSKVVGFAYEWVENLLENFPGEVTSQSDAMVKNLSDPKIGLVTTSVVLIAKIAKKQESTRLLESIMDYLQTAIRDGEQTFDQEKGFAILRTLFFHFQSSDHDKLLSFLTEYLAKSPESVFHTTVVRNLNLIITLEESLFEVRNLLKSDSSLFFDMIFKTWAISLSCALNLSILSQRYNLAAKLVLLMSFANMTAELQAELCMISRLIDLPHYAAIRTHLLQPNKYTTLFSALEGLLMILPQGDSYYDLKARLECASLCFDLEDESSTVQQTPEKTEEDPSKYVAMVVEQNLSLFHGLDKEQVLAQLN